MFRSCAALIAVVAVAALSMAATASAKELKPKFGDIDGVYYTEVSQDREACRQAIRNKIALCRQNVDFESNTKNRKYKGCLPIFKRQAESCAVHFRHQMSKCDLSGAARITDFTGFSCEVTRTVVEDGSGPDIAPLDRRMTARTRVNLRAGPGTNHQVVGSLAAGEAVQVTGRTGDWLRIAKPGGGTAFVHGDFMVASGQGPARQGRSPTAQLSPKCAPGLADDSRCWQPFANRPDCHFLSKSKYSTLERTWSGSCSDTVAVGRGSIGWTRKGKSAASTGAMVRGKQEGKWTTRWSHGTVVELHYVDSEAHGRVFWRNSDGSTAEGSYANGKMHGRWVWRYPDGKCSTARFSGGKRVSKSTRC